MLLVLSSIVQHTSLLNFSNYQHYHMIDPMNGIILAFIVGAGAGALSAYLGWNRSGEPFDSRKFLEGIITGIVAGVVLVFINIMAFKEVTDEYAYLALLGTIFIGALGADRVREDVSKAQTPPVSASTSKPVS
jgi:H+/Cl- antiporter ClcA